ncbi:FtsX-like permease family protein [Acetobacterium woodii]|uniref:ABC transport system permease protein n=1 Tax=Acetobacterium woodii (strain ATCC 29683 / DSM 1030 / JCM 2381 / KCTC 1655 / WB1) TaxID=931626 RepID=H6LCK8_ACEWD|nr:FtsX-like permease family protein [Acetobacterium woodii]AFA47790.1 ABC transport system permease protein [Acetobacterium woodii DSM 1030]
MLLKILFKNFRSSLKDYLLFFIHQSLMVVIFFVMTFFFRIAVKVSEMDHVSSLASFIYVAVVIVLIITLVSTNMNLRNYLMIRNKDYHFLAILGIRPQMLYLLLCVEFAMGSLLAILVGLLGGSFCVLGIADLLGKAGFQNDSLLVSIWNYLNSSFIFIVIIGICMASNRRYFRRSGNKANYESPIEWESYKAYDLNFLLIGCLMIIGILVSLWFYYSVLNSLISMMLLVGSACLIVFSGSRFFFKKMRKNKNLYYKNLLTFNRMMYKFNKNKKLLFTIFSLNFLIFYLMGSITASYGTLINADDQESYPYDIIAISELKMDENVINESGITAFETIPILPVYDSNDNREPHYWGISLNSYYKLTGKEEALAGNEIILISQQEGAQNSATTAMKRALTIAGSSSNYQIQKYFQEIIFGKISNKNLNNIIVFSDEEFQQKYFNANNETTLFLGEIPINFDKAAFDQRDLLAMVYKQDLLQQIKNENQMMFLIFALLGLTMMLQLGSSLYFRFFTDKNQFLADTRCLKQLGMTDKEVKKIYTKETTMLIFLPIVTSFLWSGFFFCAEMKFQNVDFVENSGLFMAFGIGYFLIELTFYKILERQLVSHVSCG